jgi:hypothetical protein
MPRWSGHGGAAAPASPPVLPLPPPPLLLLPTVDVTAADRARASSSAVGHRGGSAQADAIVGRRVEPLRRGRREQQVGARGFNFETDRRPAGAAGMCILS